MGKKITILFLFLVCMITGFSNPVNRQTAQTVATNFWNVVTGQNGSSRWIDITEETPFQEFYLFTRDDGKGFVIVAADDCVQPILGYSTDSRFVTPLPPSVEWFLNGFEHEIAYCKENNITATSEITLQWVQLMEGEYSPQSTTAVTPMLTTNWNQNPYYNNLCPDSSGYHAYAGCSAIATSQVMKYWNWPISGIGSHSYYDDNFGYQYANFGTTTYNWSLMPNYLSSSSSAAQVNAVATLVYHVGVAMEMNYGLDGSSAYTNSYGYSDLPCAELALKDYFRYKSTIHSVYREDVTNSVWISTLNSELNAGRPIIERGGGDDGGHAFVCDGYDNNGLYHINWGWGGSSNGYFAHNNLNPGSMAFNDGNALVVGIEPDGQITLSPSTLNFSQSGGSLAFTVTSYSANSSSWTASSNQSWLTLSPTTGAGSGATTTVTATATPNNTGSTRTAIITISQGTAHTTMQVTQMECSTSDMCSITLSMEDSYGDGWNGASLTLSSASGYVYGTASFNNGSSATQQFTICPSDLVLTWNTGGWDSECSFTLTNSAGVILMTATSPNFTTYTVTSPCSSGSNPPSSCTITSFPWIESFEDGISCWTIIDADGDGYTWDASFLYGTEGAAHSGDGMIASASYINSVGALTPDNWLITPAINLTSTANLTFWVKAQDASYSAENYSVYVATSNTVAAFTATTAVLTGTTTSTWEQKTVNLSSYVGQTIYIAFRHHNTTDMYWLDLDDVSISTTTSTNYTVTVTSANSSMGSATGGGSYPAGTEIELTATANSGYRFTGWNDGNTENPRYVNVTSNATYIAYFDNLGGSEHHYDNGEYASTIGAGGTLYWGIRFPAGELSGYSTLSSVKIWDIYAGTYQMSIYQGGSNAPGTQVYTQTYNLSGSEDWYTATLNTPVTIDHTQPLWIVFNNNGVSYPAAGSHYAGNPDGSWVSADNSDWASVCDYNLYYTWMIRAVLSNTSPVPCTITSLPWIEDFEGDISCWTIIDADGDGYTWDASFLYGTEGAAHTGDGMIASASYINYVGALTPDNWLISPAINLTSTANLTFWVKGQDASYSAENYSVYVATSNTVAAFTATTAVLTGTTTDEWEQKTVDLSSYVGQTIYIAFRHHNTTDMYWLDLDDVEIFAQPTGPTIAANPSTVNFGTALLGNTANATVNVSAYNLTSAITATTTAPFSVSANGTTYGTTASIAATGGTLYLRYTPTVAGTDNGTVTLSSYNATNVTISLTGNALDCSYITVPFTEGFESTIDCWTMVSMDPANDDRFGVYADPNAYAGSYDFRFSSYSTASDYNQYLITPELNLNANENYFVKFYYMGYNSYENFKVMYSTTNSNISSFTELSDYTNVATSWTEVILQLPAGTKYVAIDYYGNYQYYLYVDNFSILTSVPSMSLSTNALDFGTVSTGVTSASQTVVMSTINVNEAFTLTTAAPFEVSLDGVTFATTQTIPANATTMVNETFYVRFAPTTVGTFNQNLTVTSTNFNETITLTGEAIDCNNTTIPYTTNFDNEGSNLCWEIVDANNDGKTFNFNTADGFAYYQYSSSNVADDWLISPVFTLSGAEFCYLDYAAYSSYYPERFQVFAIDANNNNIALTGAIDVTSTDFQTQVINLTSLTGNYRIGIHCISDADKYYLLITNFNVNNNIPAASVTFSTDALDFGTIATGTTAVQEVVLNTVNVNEAFTLTTAAPFKISLDGVTFSTIQTIPANPALMVNDTIYVRFAPTAVGTFNQNLTVTSATTNNTVALTGAAVDCSNGITSFPFVYDFNTGTYPPMCWGYNDAENYGMTIVDEDAGDYAMYFQGLDMLVTPEITSTSPMALMFGYRNYLGSYGETPTSFRVGYSTTNNNVSSFTWLNTVSITDYPEGDELFFTYSANIPANTKYVAIDVLELGDYSYYNDFIFIDNFKLLTDGDIYVNPESLSFGSMIMGASPIVKTATVTSTLPTSNISVTAPANFEVSSNGTFYANTATLPQEGGTLYVRYNPSTVGNHSGNVTLTSGSISKTITVSGSAMDCSTPQTLPFFEGFESDLSGCWQNIDNDGDGYFWESSIDLGIEGYEGDGCFMSASYINSVGALYPDNWLITPALVIPSQGAILTWYVATQDPYWPEEFYEVKLSTTPNINNFTSVFSETLQSSDWEQRTVNINGNWAGQTIYIAFQHHNSSDMYMMKIDNIEVSAQTTNPMIVANPSSIEFGATELGSSANATVDVTTYNLSSAVTATTSAPFSVSTNGFTFGTTATIPATGGTLYVRYTPTTAGNDYGTVTLSAAGASNVMVSLFGSASTNYTVSVTSANPSMGSATGGGSYPAGTEIELTATANSGYRFTGWSDGYTENPRYVVVTGNATYTAQFADLGDSEHHYDNGEYAGSIGAGGSLYWGIRFAAGELSGYSTLSSVKIWNVYAGTYQMSIYQGGSTAPSSLVYSQSYYLSGSEDWYTATLNTPMTIDHTQPLWIVFNNNDVNYPAAGSHYAGNPDGSWVSTDNSDWASVCDYNFYYTWMIRAVLSNTSPAQQYTITTVSANSAMGSASGGGVYQAGDTVMLMATANSAYRFTGWSDGYTENPRYVVVTGNATYTAQFADLGDSEHHYDNGEYAGSIGAGGSLYWGIRFAAGELSGYSTLSSVKIWNVYAGTYQMSIYQGGSTAPSSLVYSQSYYLSGSEDWYTATLNTPMTIDHTQPLWIVFNNNDVNYPAAGSHYAGNPDGSWVSTDNSDWASVCDYNFYYTWMIRAVLSNTSPAQQYTITTVSANSAMGSASGGGVYQAGDTVMLMATANSAYRFTGWSDGYTENPRYVVVTGNATYTAQFADLGDSEHHYDNGEYAGSIGAGGSLYWGIRFAAGELSGYTTLSSVKIWDAYAGTYQMSIYQGGSTAPGMQVYTQSYYLSGSEDWYTATLNTPVTIDHTQPLWIVFNNNGVSYPAAGSHYAGNPDGSWVSADNSDWASVCDYNLYYTWMIRAILTNSTPIQQYTITVVSANPNMGTVSGGGTFDYGTTTEIAAIPFENYEFVRWYDGNTDNPRIITVTEDATYIAEFQATIGISEIVANEVEIYSYGRQIFVNNAEGLPVEIYDMAGKLIVSEQNNLQDRRVFTMNTSGMYLVRTGNGVVKKVSIIR